MRFVHLFVLLFVLTACAAPMASAPEPSRPVPAPTQAPVASGRLVSPLQPRLWLVTDSSAVLAAAANAEFADLPPAPPTNTAHKFAVEWLKTTLKFIARDGLPPTRAARELMLVSVALNDALLIGREAAQEQPVDNPALLAGAMWPVLRYLHPQHNEIIEGYVYVSRWHGLWLRDPVPPEQLARSFQIGQAVGHEVVTWAQQDGSDAVREIVLPASGGWNTKQLPLDPHWGTVKTIALPAGDAIVLPPPPAWDSEEMERERIAFRAGQQVLTDEYRELAWYWHADVGTVTPAGLWFETAITMALVNKLDEMQTASLLAHLGVAMHDAAVACWYNKYLYGFQRPEQWMAEVEPAWQPVLPTPPHPSYPSGHAAFSSAAANLLMVTFPHHKDLLVERAADATRSRIIGGVHWMMDGMQGMALGRDVVRYVLTR